MPVSRACLWPINSGPLELKSRNHYFLKLLCDSVVQPRLRTADADAVGATQENSPGVSNTCLWRVVLRGDDWLCLEARKKTPTPNRKGRTELASIVCHLGSWGFRLLRGHMSSMGRMMEEDNEGWGERIPQVWFPWGPHQRGWGRLGGSEPEDSEHSSLLHPHCFPFHAAPLPHSRRSVAAPNSQTTLVTNLSPEHPGT